MQSLKGKEICDRVKQAIALLTLVLSMKGNVFKPGSMVVDSPKLAITTQYGELDCHYDTDTTERSVSIVKNMKGKQLHATPLLVGLPMKFQTMWRVWVMVITFTLGSSKDVINVKCHEMQHIATSTNPKQLYSYETD